MHSLLWLLTTAAFLAPSPDDPQINPIPPAMIPAGTARWDFDQGPEGWAAEHQCRLSVAGGVLKVECAGTDPYFHRNVDVPGGKLAVGLRARSKTSGPGQIFWTSTASPGRRPELAPQFTMIHDGQWHEYQVVLDVPGRLTDVRIDPGTSAGAVEIDWIALRRPHPLAIERVDLEQGTVRFGVKNVGPSPVELESAAGGPTRTLGPGETTSIAVPVPRKRPLEPVALEVHSKGLPPVRRTVFLHHADLQTDWISLPMEGFSLQVARDGSLARVQKGDKLVAVIGPLVHVDGKLPALEPVGDGHGPRLTLEGDGVTVVLSPGDRQIGISIAGQQPCEGPVVRAIGNLEQGLLAGLEYLGRGERSSSKLDIETAGHLRFAPDVDKVTMPLLALVTDRASVAMTWKDMTLEPVYATPNFFDAAADHRMALRGRKIEATVRIDDGSLEEQILWAVKEQGLPPLPKPPRTPGQQRALCLKALGGPPLRTDRGWGHCAGWAAQPFGDMASTVWRLGGQVPQLERLVPGGAHVRNDAVYFVTGRVDQWLAHRKAEVQGIIRRQAPDGSFHYGGKLRRGHFEDTASGVCDRPAYVLLQYAQYTGDQEALAAGLKTLEYLKRFRTPRGAQTWEVPLHTPDQLSSAYAVWANVLGYELTGKKEYLAEARRWALSGVPFTYLWGRYPIMVYSTIPVLGATHWRHSWFGLPVQWVGGVYAYALVKLAPYDDSLDWKHLARGILICAQQQQYPDGPRAGLLPDSFALKTQQRRPADINPCALVSLETVLDGRLDSLAVAVEAGHRIVAPFPVTIRQGKAHVQGQKGLTYQVLIDGRRIVDVKSQGEDVVPVQSGQDR